MLRSYGRMVGLVNTYVQIHTTSNEIKISDLVKFVMCTLVSMVHMTFYILTYGYIVPGNQGTHDKPDPLFLEEYSLRFCCSFQNHIRIISYEKSIKIEDQPFNEQLPFLLSYRKKFLF